MTSTPKSPSILRAIALLGSSSALSILCGLLSTKVWAKTVGPDGVGRMGLMQGLLALLLTLAGLGVSTGLVRKGAFALSQGDKTQFAALRQGAWWLFWTVGGATVLCLWLFPGPIARVALDKKAPSSYVVLVGLGLLFSLAASVQTGLLNAYHRVGALAKSTAISAILGAAGSLALAWFWRERGIGPAVVFTVAVSWMVSRWFLQREERLTASVTRRETLQAAWSLARFGGPYAVSTLLGAGVQNLLPFLVLYQLGLQSAGYYRAAAMIAVNYLAFLLNSMSQDYYPRVAAAGDQPAALVALVNQQFRLVILLGAPVVLGSLALAPYIVPLIYSAQFAPAVEILEWQLIGDLFKLSAWTMAFVILARSASVTYFCTETFAGVTMAVTAWFGLRWWGLAGIGIAFLITGACYYNLVWYILRREIGFVWTGENKRLFLLALLSALLIRGTSFVGLAAFRTPIALALAAAAAAFSAHTLWKETRRHKVPSALPTDS